MSFAKFFWFFKLLVDIRHEGSLLFPSNVASVTTLPEPAFLTGFLAHPVSRMSRSAIWASSCWTAWCEALWTELYHELIDKKRGLERERVGETGPESAEHLARIVESLDRFSLSLDRIEPAKTPSK